LASEVVWLAAQLLEDTFQHWISRVMGPCNRDVRAFPQLPYIAGEEMDSGSGSRADRRGRKQKIRDLAGRALFVSALR
jgi:hypothetical protein